MACDTNTVPVDYLGDDGSAVTYTVKLPQLLLPENGNVPVAMLEAIDCATGELVHLELQRCNFADPHKDMTY